jgi:hypothetical protein
MKVAGFLGENVSFGGCRSEEKIKKTRHGIHERDAGPRVGSAGGVFCVASGNGIGVMPRIQPLLTR